MSIFNSEFFNHIYILLALMVGFTVFKIANCKPFKEDGEDFNIKTLGLGIVRNILVIIGSVVVFLVSSQCGSDLFLIQVGETQVTLQSAIDLVTLTILATYGVKYVKNLAEYAGVGDKTADWKEVEDFNVSTDDQEDKG